MKAINPSDHISQYFTYHEALWLKQWGRHAGVNDGLNDDVLNRLVNLFLKADELRKFFGAPMNCHDCYRPRDYNNITFGAAKESPHMALLGEAALDFDVVGMNCDVARRLILDNKMLDSLGLRMEDRYGSNWIHIDTRVPQSGHLRFFKP